MGLSSIERCDFGVRLAMALKPPPQVCSQALACFLGASASGARSNISAALKMDVPHFVRFGN